MAKRWIVIYLFMCSVLVFILVVLKPKTSNGAAFVQSVTQYPTGTPIPTNTFIPSATIGYESTLQVAQSTADEARRINAVVTSEYEQRLLEQVQLTAAYEQRVQEIYSWTVTAALTSVPLTQTQQAVMNTQIPMQNNLAFAQLTATAQAPTQMAALIQAQESVRYVKFNNIMDIIGRFLLMGFMGSLIYFVFKFPVQPKPEVPNPGETVVMLKRDRGQGSFTMVRNTIPCSPDQLTELAQKIIEGKKTLAINQWEGAGTLFTRPVILAMRAWMRENGFAVATEENQLVPTVEGLDFFLGWLASQKLPSEFEFGETENVHTETDNLVLE